jgi:phage-related tail protein
MIQVGLIAAQKPPQFAKGTKGSQVTPPGFKWVGEEGPELIHEPGGAKIITHADSMQILKNYNLPAAPSLTPQMPHAPELSAMNAVAVQQGIDYKKLGKVIAEELRNNPQTSISIDKGGFSLHLIQKGKSVENLNNRYSG